MGKFLDETGLSTLVTNIKTALGKKQDTLTSGTNIKTVNSQSLLGSGDVTVGDVTAADNNVFTGKNMFNGYGVSIGTLDMYVNVNVSGMSQAGDTPIVIFTRNDDASGPDTVLRKIATPVQGTDAANKSYVDTQISTALGTVLTQLQNI